jgi:hypothetical protein
MADEIEVSKSSNEPAGYDPEAVRDLLERATKGDKSCLPQLRALFSDPNRTGLLNADGSPPDWLESKLIDGTAGKNLAVKEASSRKLAQGRKELEGPDPSPTERLLAERAAICWWLVNRYEEMYVGSENLSIRQAEFQQRRIDRAHKHYLSALRTLATIRMLALPALQVNIGANQVNTVQADDGP